MTQVPCAVSVFREHAEILDRQTEMELLRRWHVNEDLAARQRLVLAYRPQAKNMASRHAKSTGLPVADLCQEAMSALMEAIDNYDIKQHSTRVSTLALWHIRGRLQRFTLDYSGPCRVGTNFHDKRVFSRYRGLRAKWEAEHQRSLDETGRNEIAAALGVKREVLNRMEPRIVGGDVALDAQVFASDDDRNNGETTLVCEENPEARIIEDHDYRRAVQALQSHVNELPERERSIVQRRLFSNDPAQLGDIGEELGLSKERVRQIERSAIMKLRTAIEKMGFSRSNLFA